MLTQLRISRRNLYFALSFIMPMCILALSFAAAGIFPFGAKHIIMEDLADLYLPSFVSLSRFIRGGGSFLWSWEAGGGFEYVNNIGALLSPVNLFLVLLPENLIHTALIPAILIKLGFAGLFTALYLERKTGRVSFLLPVMSCLYALCFFALQNYWNVIFLDSFALLPLVMLGFHEFMRTGKFKLYIISLFFCIAINSNIGWFVCVFAGLSFIGESFVLKLSAKEISAKLARFALYSLTAAGLAFFVLYPLYIKNSSVAGTEELTKDLIAFGFQYLGYGFAPFRVPDGYINDIQPFIYCGVLCIPAAGLYLRSEGVSKREKAVFVFFTVFLLFSLIFSPLDFAWNLFRWPRGIWYRYIFLLPFVFVTASYTALSQFKPFTRKSLTGACIFSVPILICLLIEPGRSFFVPCLALIVVYIFLLNGYTKSKDKIYAVLIAMLVTAELAFSGYLVVTSYDSQMLLADYKEYSDSVKTANTLLKKRESAENDFYRTEFQGYAITETSRNAALLTGSNGLSIWSSLIERSKTNFYKGLGVSTQTNLSAVYNETSPLTGMFMNLRYLIGKQEDIKGLGLWNTIAEENGVLLLENRYYLPLGFIVKSDTANYKPSYTNAFESQNNLFKAATGLNDDLFTITEPKNVIPLAYRIVSEDNGLYAFQTDYFSTENAAAIIWEYYAPKDGVYYCHFIPNIDKENESSDILVISNVTDAYLPFMRFGEACFTAATLKEEEQLIFSFSPASAAGTIALHTAVLNEDILMQGYEILKAEPLRLTEFSNTYIKGEVTTQEGGLLYLSVPVGGSDYWRAYVNGEQASIILIDGLMAALEVPQGTHTIELKFSNSDFTTAVIVSLSFLALFLCIVKFKP